jgi:NTP pyrophosphatase (non-canonical NTP hydrolase)
MKVALLNDGPVTILIDSKIENKMNLKNSQLDVDTWIKEHGVRYFNELTNMAQLTEEVGEVARIIMANNPKSDKIKI